MSTKEKVLEDVMRALKVIDKEYLKKQKELGDKSDWRRAKRLQSIREGIKHSIKVVDQMRNYQIEVI